MCEDAMEQQHIRDVARAEKAEATLAAIRRHVEERFAWCRRELGVPDGEENEHRVEELEGVKAVLGEGGAALLERVAKLEAIDKAADDLLALMIGTDSMQQPEYLDSRSFTHEEFEPLRAARKAAKR